MENENKRKKERREKGKEKEKEEEERKKRKKEKKSASPLGIPLRSAQRRSCRGRTSDAQIPVRRPRTAALHRSGLAIPHHCSGRRRGAESWHRVLQFPQRAQPLRASLSISGTWSVLEN